MKEKLLLIYGNNKVLMDEEQARYTTAILAGRDASLCCQRFNIQELLKASQAEGDQIGQFLLTLQTPPFLTDRQIFILSNIEALRGKKELLSKISDALGTVAKGNDTWVILKAEVAKESEIATTLLKVIKTSGKVAKFVSYDDAKPDQWCMQHAKSLGLNLPKPAALLLISLAGNQLARLGSELEKLSLLLPKGEMITQQHLLENIHGGTEYSIFRITQSLSEKKLTPALETLDQVLRTVTK